jgi:hypothetical protein
VACFDEINQTKPMTAGRMFQISKQALRFCKVRRYAASDSGFFLHSGWASHPANVTAYCQIASWLMCALATAMISSRSLLFSRLKCWCFGARTMEVRLSMVRVGFYLMDLDSTERAQQNSRKCEIDT